MKEILYYCPKCLYFFTEDYPYRKATDVSLAYPLEKDSGWYNCKKCNLNFQYPDAFEKLTPHIKRQLDEKGKIETIKKLYLQGDSNRVIEKKLWLSKSSVSVITKDLQVSRPKQERGFKYSQQNKIILDIDTLIQQTFSLINHHDIFLCKFIRKLHFIRCSKPLIYHIINHRVKVVQEGVIVSGKTKITSKNIKAFNVKKLDDDSTVKNDIGKRIIDGCCGNSKQSSIYSLSLENHKVLITVHKVMVFLLISLKSKYMLDKEFNLENLEFYLQKRKCYIGKKKLENIFEKYDFSIEYLHRWAQCYVEKSEKFPEGMEYDLILPNRYKINFIVGEIADGKIGEDFTVCDLHDCKEVIYLLK